MKKTNIYRLYILVSILLTLVYFISVYEVFSGDWGKIGNFGNMFGALGVLFSLFAFLGVVSSLKYQREQIEEQAKSNKLQASQNLLAARISASVSKQEILAQFITSEKIHPSLDFNANHGQYRDKLLSYLKETESLVLEAKKLVDE